jgi:hypothetical protein
VNPAVEVGFNIPGAGAAATQTAWPPILPAFAGAVRTPGERYELPTDVGDMASSTAVTSAASVDVDWFAARMG